MPVRLYEIARDLNYSLGEIMARQDEIEGMLNSPFSVLSGGDEKKIRKLFPARDPNPCLLKQKPKVKRASKP